MSRNKENNKWLTRLFGWTIVLAFLLPHTSTVFLMMNPLLCILLKMSGGRSFSIRQNAYVVVPLVITMVLSLAQPNITIKSILMLITMILYYYLFPFMRITKLPNIYLNICLWAIVISQLAYVFHIPFAITMLDLLYPLQDDIYSVGYAQSNATIYDVFDYRMGGLYRNANLCAMSLSLLLASYIVFNNERNIRKNIIFIVVCCAGILLTGSRTGFAVMSSLLVYYVYQDKRIPKIFRVSAALALLVGIVYIILIGSEYFRALNVSSGLNDSASMKFSTFMYYITTEKSIIRFLFGYMDASLFEAPSLYMNYFDSDYGNIIFCYGIIGFLSICVYFFLLLKKMDKMRRMYFITLLWMVSAAIISSYRHLFIFMLLLTVIYQIQPRYKSSKSV